MYKGRMTRLRLRQRDIFVVFCVTDISNGLTGHGGYSKTFEVMTATLPLLSKGSVAYFLAVHFYQGNPDR